MPGTGLTSSANLHLKSQERLDMLDLLLNNLKSTENWHTFVVKVNSSWVLSVFPIVERDPPVWMEVQIVEIRKYMIRRCTLESLRGTPALKTGYLDTAWKFILGAGEAQIQRYTGKTPDQLV